MSTRPEHLSTALADRHHVGGNVDDVLSPALTGTQQWQEFAAGWNRLPVDPHMADGGTYRLRRFSEFRCDAAASEPVLLPHRPFFQPRAINRLNGGVHRRFAPLEHATGRSPVLRRILTWSHGLLTELHGAAVSWHVLCFQNRTLARKGVPGRPTPEGVHRDGVDYNLLLLIERYGVSGGVNTVYAAGSGAPIRDALLSAPGDFLFLDDRRTLHGASDVTPVGPTDGYRDVLVMSFTAHIQ